MEKVLQEQSCMIEEIEVRNQTLLDSIFGNDSRLKEIDDEKYDKSHESEIILMKRQAVYYLLSIGLPSVLTHLFLVRMSGQIFRNCSSSFHRHDALSIMSSAFSVSQAHSSLIRQTTGKIDSTFSRIYGRIYE